MARTVTSEDFLPGSKVTRLLVIRIPLVAIMLLICLKAAHSTIKDRFWPAQPVPTAAPIEAPVEAVPPLVDSAAGSRRSSMQALALAAGNVFESRRQSVGESFSVVPAILIRTAEELAQRAVRPSQPETTQPQAIPAIAVVEPATPAAIAQESPLAATVPATEPTVPTGMPATQPVETPAVAAPTESPAPTLPRPSTLVILNPVENSGDVHYLLDAQRFSLQPGESRDLPGARSRRIHFHRGAEFGEARYLVSPGTYKFHVTDRGWELSRIEPSN